MDSIKKIITNTKETANSPQYNQPQIVYRCDECKDTGYILSGEGLDMVARICKCQKIRNTERKIKSARISKLLRNCTFDTFEYHYYSQKVQSEHNRSYRELAKKAVDAAAAFVYNILQGQHPGSLMYIGKTGRGKTFLAAAIANELLERKPDTQLLFIVVPDLLNEIRSTYEKNTVTTEYEIIDAARNAEILILDDLGAHNYSDWVKDKLYSIIDYRLQEQLPTVITTNLPDPPAMSSVLGERITSRVFQLCKTYPMASESDIRLINSYEQMSNVFRKNNREQGNNQE